MPWKFLFFRSMDAILLFDPPSSLARKLLRKFASRPEVLSLEGMRCSHASPPAKDPYRFVPPIRFFYVETPVPLASSFFLVTMREFFIRSLFWQSKSSPLKSTITFCQMQCSVERRESFPFREGTNSPWAANHYVVPRSTGFLWSDPDLQGNPYLPRRFEKRCECLSSPV